MNILTTVKGTAMKAAHGVSKNSPLILTSLGVVGLVATSYLTYKSASRVREITNDLESKRIIESRINELQEKEEPEDEEAEELEVLSKNFEGINRFEVLKDLAGALALPVSTGLASVGLIALGYNILNGRLTKVATALASTVAERVYFERKYEDKYGKEEADQFFVHEEEYPNDDSTELEDDEPKKVQSTVPDLYGRWFKNSTEYASDDPSYNATYIDNVAERLQNKLFANGYLVLNEVLETLGFPREKVGGIVGWTTGDNFDLSTTVVRTEDGKSEIFVKWTTPSYIYDDIDYNGGRYSL